MSSERSAAHRRPTADAWAWVGLALAMSVAAVVILRAARGLTFGADELSYFGRLVEGGDEAIAHGFDLEYLLAPHNGHLQVGGKLVYEASFGLFGSAHAPLRVAALAGVLAGVALFFELARRRVGPAPALAAAVVLLFGGGAWEVMLWPFDIHTTYALAFGLGALLALERDDRRGDAVACALLVGSIAMIEVGLAMTVAAAVVVALGRRPLRRAWIVAIPLVAYAAWWLWSRRFDHEDLELERIADLPASVAESLTAVVAALTGLYAHGAGVWPSTLDPESAAALLAAGVAIALAVALWRRASPRAWALLAALGAYWVLIALADRPSDSSRYMWVGATLLLLLGAEVVSGWARRAGHGAALAAAIGVCFVVALPVSLDKLSDGRDSSLAASDSIRAEFAMLELAGDRADPGFNPGARLFASPGLPAARYRQAAERVGPLGLPIETLRRSSAEVRTRADRVLGAAYDLSAVPLAGSAVRCERARGEPVALPSGGAAFVGGREGGELALGRFSGAGSVPLGPLRDGERVAVEIPPDGVGDPWWAFAPPGARICELG